MSRIIMHSARKSAAVRTSGPARSIRNSSTLPSEPCLRRSTPRSKLRSTHQLGTAASRSAITDATKRRRRSISPPGGSLDIESSTVIGRIHTREMTLVSNSILLASRTEDDAHAPIRSERRQAGCIRFSYLPRDSIVPRCFQCQSHLAIRTAIDARRRKKTKITDGELQKIVKQIALRMQPVFTERRYGRAGYMQLANSTPTEIRRGAEDEAEMGVFRTLSQPQRETNLRVRLQEYLRFGLEAGIFYVT